MHASPLNIVRALERAQIGQFALNQSPPDFSASSNRVIPSRPQASEMAEYLHVNVPMVIT